MLFRQHTLFSFVAVHACARKHLFDAQRSIRVYKPRFVLLTKFCRYRLEGDDGKPKLANVVSHVDVMSNKAEVEGYTLKLDIVGDIKKVK